jgi:hypothetical protein
VRAAATHCAVVLALLVLFMVRGSYTMIGARALLRSVPMRTIGTLACALLTSCAHGPSAAETLPKLAAALDAPVESPAQNGANSALVEQVSNDKFLHQMTRGEVAQALGREGEPCSRHPICGERGFDGEDWYYEVGREGASYIRHRPALIVGFSRFGKVERTFVLRAPE